MHQASGPQSRLNLSIAITFGCFKRRHASNAKISCQKSQISGHLGANFYAFAPLTDQGHLLRKKLHALRPLPEALANTAVNSDDIR